MNTALEGRFLSPRVLVMLVCILLAVGAIGAMHALPRPTQHFLMDRPTPRMLENRRQIELEGKTEFHFPYPLTVQNIMWVVFFIGLGELFLRFSDGRAESAQVGLHLLPEDERTILRADDLKPIYARVRDLPGADARFLPRLIKRVILQFQLTRSVDQANALMNSSLELYLHEIDLRYNMLRYIMWLIPSLGFIGTVVGIALALAFAGKADFQDPTLLSNLSDRLGVAFYTTLLALIHAAVLVALMHLAQAKEEKALNDAGQYCMDNLINRLYDK